MDNEEEVVQACFIGLLVANFVLNTDRVHKAIELCKECLILLKNYTHKQENELRKELYRKIYSVIFFAYSHISDYTNAARYGRKLRVMLHEYGDIEAEGKLCMDLAKLCESQSKFTEAKNLYRKALNIMIQTSDRNGEAGAYGKLGNLCYHLKEYAKAKEYIEKALAIRIDNRDRKGEALCLGNLGPVFKSLGEYVKAEEYLEKALAIRIEIGDRRGEAIDYGHLGTMFMSLGEYLRAEKYLEKALAIEIEIGDRRREASCYVSLALVFKSLGDYAKAEEHLKKALEIRIEIDDRRGEATDYENLATVFVSIGEYIKAKEYLEKALTIRIEIGDRRGEAESYENFATVFNSPGEYVKAKEYLEKALAIRIEIGDRSEEATDYGKLGTLFRRLYEYVKAKEYFFKELAIKTEIGDRKGEAECNGNLATVSMLLCEYVKVKEYLDRALVISIEIGDRKEEATYNGNLGNVFMSLGKYVKAKEYLEKSLAINIEIGDRKGQAACYGNLGAMFKSLGEYVKAKEFLEKALAIRVETGDRGGKASDYGNLGAVFMSLGEYVRAEEYIKKSLVITLEIGDRSGEAAAYGNLGAVFESLDKYVKAKQYLEKAVAIKAEIGDRSGEAVCLANLGNVCMSLGDFNVAADYLEKALSISRDIGYSRSVLNILVGLTLSNLVQDKLKDAFSCLFQSIEKFEELRNFLGVNDQFKTSFLEESGTFPYKLLSKLLSMTGNPRDAFYVEELRRARGLADLIASQYSIKTHISSNPESWVGLENIMREESNGVCLYISYFYNDVHLWVLKSGGVNYFKRTLVGEKFVQAGLNGALTVSEFLAKSFRGIGIFPEEDCEDRSLNVCEPQRSSSEQKNPAPWRLFELDDEEIIDEISSLSLCYKLFIAPVDNLLEEPEIIVVPDSSLYKVPFHALSEKEGAGYLSETHRIRIVPSLTTLKLIKDSPAGYHSQTGALIVGDPKVGWVTLKGRREYLTSLPSARKEAKMVARLVGVEPLLGEQATKQAVLEKITSVSLIHFAAHGDAERGEIALSPIRTPGSSDIAHQEEEYLLTMADISEVKVRAKLVVLSCCHSGKGQIRAEGVIGIARAFLGSGARSVLVALWAIQDTTTEQLMSRFYKHLASGKSGSESLHEAMKWMRNNGFTKVSEWAPFMLIGDNVCFDFSK